MARGPSGRIVVEIDPAQKREIYALLSSKGNTFKAWLQRQISNYVDQHQQHPLSGLHAGDSSARSVQEVTFTAIL
jgi:hypothetical protein